MKQEKKEPNLKIGELSRLFQISADSIRYYERVGILNPIRDENNNYRQYTAQDLRRLIMIRELLSLNFSTEQIRSYYENRSMESTRQLLEQEQVLIEMQIKSLQEKQKNIKSRIRSINLDMAEAADESISLRHISERFIYRLNRERIPDAYVDFYLLEQIRDNNQHINIIGACDCFELDLEQSRPDSDYLWTKSVFFHSDEINLPSNDKLPEGDYLQLSYHGSPKKTKAFVKKMYQYAGEKGYEIVGNPMEFCRIDDYETSIQEEYLITLQVRVLLGGDGT